MVYSVPYSYETNSSYAHDANETACHHSITWLLGLGTIPLESSNVSVGRAFRDVILGGDTAVYRLGCGMTPQTDNLVSNPSFEEFVVAGSPSVRLTECPVSLQYLFPRHLSLSQVRVSISASLCVSVGVALGPGPWKRRSGSQGVTVVGPDSAVARKTLSARGAPQNRTCLSTIR